MKKYNKTIALITILLMILAIVMPYTIVYGAASTSFSASKTTMTVGETIKITASINATETWSLKVTSNGGTLSGTSQSTDAEGSEVSKQIISCDFTASSAGTYTITLAGTIAGSDLKKQTVSKQIKITVNNKSTDVTPPSNNEGDLPQESNPGTSSTGGTTVTKSSNNYLSSLKVSEGSLSPEFNFRTYSYRVEVGKDVESIKVTASAEHAKAKVSGTGTKTLKPGENKINVRVKAEDGKERTYTIVVNRQEEPTEDIKLGLKSVSLKGVIKTEEGEQIVDLPYLAELFSSEVYSYNVLLSEQERAITAIRVEAIANKEDAIVKILDADEDLVDGDNIITILVTSADGEESVTYQIIVNKPEEQVLPINADIQMQEQNGVGWGPIQKTLITIFTTIIALFGVAYGVIEYRYKKEDKEEFGIPYSNIETTKEDKKTSKPKTKKTKKEEKEDIANNVLNNSIQEATGKFRSKKDSGKHF